MDDYCFSFLPSCVSRWNYSPELYPHRVESCLIVNKLCWAIFVDLLSLTMLFGPWSRLIWLCWIKIIGFRGLMKCTFHLPKWMNDFNLIKVLPWPICVCLLSPPSSSSIPFYPTPLIGQWHLNILRLIGSWTNTSMDDIRSTLWSFSFCVWYVLGVWFIIPYL